jgi:O-antigen/teichoic acid export membrane protein
MVTVLGYGVTSLIGLVALRAFTELAPPEVFGTANLALSASTLAATLFIAPITNTQLRFHTLYRGERGAGFTRLVLQCAIATAIAVCAIGACVWGGWAFVGDAPLNSFGLAALCALFAATVVRNVLLNRAQAERRQVFYVGVQVTEAVLVAALTAAALLIARSAEGYIAGQAIGAIGVVALLFVFEGPRLRTSEVVAPQELKERIRSYGLVFIPIGLLTFAANMSDRYVLGAMTGSAAVGQYVAPFAIASRAMGIANAIINDLLRPALFDAENLGQTDRARRIFRLWLGARAALAALSIVGIFIAGPLIAKLLLAEEYRPGAVQIMAVVALAYAIYGTTQTLETRLMSLDHSRKLLPPLILGSAGNIALSLYLIPTAGALGAAQATAGSFLLQMFATAYFLSRARRGQNVPPTVNATGAT